MVTTSFFSLLYYGLTFELSVTIFSDLPEASRLFVNLLSCACLNPTEAFQALYDIIFNKNSYQHER